MAKIRQTKLTKSARGKDCTLRLFPYCNHTPETTVLAHINSDAKGMSRKSPDWFAIYCCYDCHKILDGHRFVDDISEEELLSQVIRALHLTQEQMIEQGLIKV